MNEIKVVGFDEAPFRTCEVAFDPNIPLRFRTSSSPSGAAYLRIGKLADTLVELMVDPNTHTLIGCNLSTASGLRALPQYEINGKRHGLPVLEPSTGQRWIESVALVPCVSVSVSDIVVYWRPVERCIALEFGRMNFLVAENSLCGFMCSEVTASEMRTFRESVPSPS